MWGLMYQFWGRKSPFSIWIITHNNINLKVPEAVFLVIWGNLPENKMNIMKDQGWRWRKWEQERRRKTMTWFGSGYTHSLITALGLPRYINQYNAHCRGWDYCSDYSFPCYHLHGRCILPSTLMLSSFPQLALPMGC